MRNALLQAEVLRREVGRLAGENARLHQDLLQEAEARVAQGTAAADAARAAEAAAADAALARQQALERAAAVEQERDALRAKVRDLLAFGAHHAGGGCWAARARRHQDWQSCCVMRGPALPACMPHLRASILRQLLFPASHSLCCAVRSGLADEANLCAALGPKLTATAPLEPRPAPAAQARTSRGAISLIKAADARILALEAELRRREAEGAALSAQLQQAQVSRSSRPSRTGAAAAA